VTSIVFFSKSLMMLYCTTLGHPSTFQRQEGIELINGLAGLYYWPANLRRGKLLDIHAGGVA
jgi:hypothetical protein